MLTPMRHTRLYYVRQRSLRQTLLLLAVLALGLSSAPHAQTLHQAVEGAWGKQAGTRTQAARTDALAARRRASNALTPDAPALTLGHRNDGITGNQGKREVSVELSSTLWLPGQKRHQQALIDAETGAYHANQGAAKLQLAVSVRNGWWQARLAAAEREVAAQRLAGASALAKDVARRVKAGDLAKVDANRALAEQQTAAIALGEAELNAFQTLQQFTLLTGLSALPSGAEVRGEIPSDANQPRRDGQHPQRAAVQNNSSVAAAKIAYAAASGRDAPELSVEWSRERSRFDERFDNSIMLRLKIPFASDARNQPRMAEALAERAEALAIEEQENARITAGIALAGRALAQADASVLLAQTRADVARDTHQLLERAFNLGEIDLPTRIRAGAELFDAERGLVKAQLEAAHAISSLNQALGYLP
jgi:cobalt-zinc-cadmium efflux system outer membrane protein